MANNADQIVVASNGTVYVGETSASAPTDATSSLSGFTELGFVTEDGVTFTDSKTNEPINVWQSFYPVRRVVTEKEATVTFSLRQWNNTTIPLAFGGGTISGTGPFTYTPPAPEDLDERSLVVDWQDGEKSYRLYFGKGMVTEAVETNLTRTGSAVLPITFSVTPAAGDDPYLLFVDDDEFSS